MNFRHFSPLFSGHLRVIFTKFTQIYNNFNFLQEKFHSKLVKNAQKCSKNGEKRLVKPISHEKRE